MLNNILNLKGVQTLNKEEQQSLIAGNCSSCTGDEYQACVRTCAGSCTPNGTCYQIEF